MLSATIYTVVQGLTYPLLSLILNGRGTPEWLIGFNAAMMPAGMLVAAALTPRIVAFLGLYVTNIASLFGVSVSLLLIGLIDDFWAWLPLRFITGFLLSCIFVVTDTWVNELVDDSSRGRVIGTYSMLLSVGFAVGPGILVVVGSSGFLPFTVVVLLPLAAALPLIVMRNKLPTGAGEPPKSAFGFVKRAPLILLCVIAASFADQGAMSLLPVYSLQEGFSQNIASFSLVVMIVGSIVLMFPIGWLADKVSRPKLLIACTIITLLLSALFPVAAGTLTTFFIVTFFWGGIYYGIYTLGLVRLGQQFRGADFVSANSAAGAMWGIGGIIGTPFIGALMQPFGPSGFPYSLVIAFGLLLAVLVLFRKHL